MLSSRHRGILHEFTQRPRARARGMPPTRAHDCITLSRHAASGASGTPHRREQRVRPPQPQLTAARTYSVTWPRYRLRGTVASSMPFTVKSKMDVGDSGAGSGVAGASLARRAARATTSADMVHRGLQLVVRARTPLSDTRSRDVAYVVGGGWHCARRVACLPLNLHARA